MRDEHAVLCAVVRQKLLPALAQKVEVEEISTIHNPIRARTVDGTDVTHLHYDSSLRTEGLLTPASVDVTGAEVLAIARALTANAGTHRLPPETGAASECSVRRIRRIETATLGGSSVQ